MTSNECSDGIVCVRVNELGCRLDLKRLLEEDYCGIVVFANSKVNKNNAEECDNLTASLKLSKFALDNAIHPFFISTRK